jgi:hypothetical protein
MWSDRRRAEAVTTTSKKDAGSAVVRQAFGAPLSQQGRGFYVTLELLAICWGTQHGSLAEVLPQLSEQAPIRYALRSHDFARRWMAAENLADEERAHVRGDDAEVTLRTLLVSLRVPIPHRHKLPPWGYQHLYPYVGELIHYDALQKYGRTLMERNTYRGGGGLAHKILRTDPDAGRLNQNRAGLRELVTEDGGPLGRLLKAMGAHDLATRDDEFTDQTETEAIVHGGSRWVEQLREGVKNITIRHSTPRAKKVELLMHWVPYCIARHQIDRATEILGLRSMSIPVSVDPDAAAMRQAGRRQLDAARSAVNRAVHQVAEDRAKQNGGPAGEPFRALLDGGSWKDAPLQFLTGTLATVGALNAHTGRRHFTASLPLLEALVHATLKPDRSVTFEGFCEGVLYDELGLIVDPVSGSRVRLTDDIDHGELARNSEFLAYELKGLGLLEEFSDATRMVHAEVSR